MPFKFKIKLTRKAPLTGFLSLFWNCCEPPPPLITDDLPLTLSMQLLSSPNPKKTLNFRMLFSKHNDSLAKPYLKLAF